MAHCPDSGALVLKETDATGRQAAIPAPRSRGCAVGSWERLWRRWVDVQVSERDAAGRGVWRGKLGFVRKGSSPFSQGLSLLLQNEVGRRKHCEGPSATALCPCPCPGPSLARGSVQCSAEWCRSRLDDGMCLTEEPRRGCSADLQQHFTESASASGCGC